MIKAMKLLNEINEKLPEEHRVRLKFPNGWVDRFKKRQNFHSQTSHGESGHADDSAI